MSIVIIDPKIDHQSFYNKALAEIQKIIYLEKLPSNLTELGSETDLILLETRLTNPINLNYSQNLIEKFPHIPLVLISNPISEDYIIEAYKSGIADYIIRPISLKLFTIRILSKIKNNTSIKRIGELELNIEAQVAMLERQKINLTPIETKLLSILFENPGVIFSRKEIQEKVWEDVHVQNQNIDTHISNLRKKLFPFSKKIQTVKSRGYIFNL